MENRTMVPAALSGSGEPAGPVTCDAFLGGALDILQPRRGYRAGLDAVMLAAAVPVTAGRGERVLDAGAGVGAAGLCVAWRVPDARVVLAEKEEALVRLAEENIRRNALSGRVEAVTADVTAPAAALARLGLGDGSFARVLSNPPFHGSNAATPSPERLKAAAHIMPGGLRGGRNVEAGFAAWARFLARVTMPGGTVSLIHKAEALPIVLAALEGRFGALSVRPIHARAGEPALRILVRGVKGSRAPLVIAPGFIVHGGSGAFSPEAEAVLRHGLPLPFDGP